MGNKNIKVRRVDYYPDEFLVGVSGMTSEQIGVYWVVCSLIYSSGGPILERDPRIMRCGGVSTRRWPGLLAELVEIGKLTVVDGRLHNRRAAIELGKTQDRVSKARDNGHLGGRPTAEADDVDTCEVPEKTDFTGSSAGVQQEFAGSSTQVGDWFVHGEVGNFNNLAKPNGFSDEKLTSNQQPAPKKETPFSPPAGGGSPTSGELNDRGLLGGSPAPTSKRKRGSSPKGESTDRDPTGEDPAGASRRKGGTRADRGTRVPEGDLPEEWAVAANKTREDNEFPLLNRRVLKRRWTNFANFWRGISGSKGLKLDWRATWLNDCINHRTEQRFPPETPGSDDRRPPKFDTTG